MSKIEVASLAPASASLSEVHQTSELMRIIPSNRVSVVVPANEAADNGADMSRYFHSFRRRWLIACVVGVPLAALALFAAWGMQPKAYTATAVLRLASVENLLVFETADSKGSNSFEIYKRTQRQWMRSRFVIMRALRDFESLSKLSLFSKGTDPTDWLEDNLMVTFPDDSEVMLVSLSGDSPEGLHELVNAVVDAYFEEIVNVERNRKLARLNNLELAHKKAENELRSKRSDFKQLVEKVGTGDSTALTIVQQNALNQYAQFQQHFAKIRIDLMRAKHELELNKSSAEPDSAMPLTDQELLVAMRTDSAAGQLKAEKQKILDQMEVIRNRFKKDIAAVKLEDQGRQLQDCDERLEVRKQALRIEMIEQKRLDAAAGIPSLERQIALLTNQETELQKKVKELEAEAKQIGKSSIDVDMLRSEIAAIQSVVSSLAAELGRTRVEMQPETTKEETSRVSSKSKAQPARLIDSKSKKAKIVGAGVAGLFLPVLFVIWLDVRKNRISSGSEVERELGLSLIGSVPLIPQRVMRHLDGPSPRQQYWRTLLAESVDSTAAVLLQGMQSGTCRMVMVSSAHAGEGKTTLAAHVATSLAGAGRRTALVDFDLRRPALHRVLGMSLEPGIVDLLAKAETFEAAVQATQIPNLMFIPAGRWKGSGLSRLAADDLKCLFDRLRSEFEFVVVDGSPILPVVDTRLIAQHVDAVVLSVLRDVSCTPQVRAACQLLELFNVPILGVVMTGSRGDGYYSRYGYDPYIDVKAT